MGIHFVFVLLYRLPSVLLWEIRWVCPLLLLSYTVYCELARGPKVVVFLPFVVVAYLYSSYLSDIAWSALSLVM